MTTITSILSTNESVENLPPGWMQELQGWIDERVTQIVLESLDTVLKDAFSPANQDLLDADPH
jgi:hypothetical protein